MNHLYQILEKTQEQYGDQIALDFQNYQISYTKVKEAADKLAAGFRQIGFEPGDKMAVMLPNVPQFAFAYFGLLKIGITIVPLPTLYKAEELHHRLEDSESKGIIYWEGYRDHVIQAVNGLEHCKKLIVLGNESRPGEIRLSYLLETSDPIDDIHNCDPDDTALIVYTAGITGYPRGAELTHHNILSSIESVCNFLKINNEDSVVGAVPFYHLLGHTLVMGAFFRAGARIILIPRIEASAVVKNIVDKEGSYLIGMPSIYREILELENVDKIKMDSLKMCFSSGDALQQETLEKFEALFQVPIIEGYGLTEASGMVSFNNLSIGQRAGSIGLPLPGVELRIVDEKDEDVKTGQVGEIIIQGPSVMKGYLNRQEATREVLRDGWLRTGDLARLDESGHGIIVVRKKTVIVKSGFSVYPREVERYLYGFPKVKEAAVVGVPDKMYGEEIHAVVVLKDGEQATQEEIVEYMKDRMAAYKCPRVIHFENTLPKGATGRVLRDQIKNQITEN